MTGHSILAPSSAYRWVLCPASVQMEAKFPVDMESEAAKEGTLAHRVALEGYEGPDVTDEMREGRRMLQEALGGPAAIEEYVTMPGIHPRMFGTVDARATREDTLHIWEYKYGHGYVDEFENWQMIAYTAGLLGTQTSVKMTVVQPRNYHEDGPVRTWTISASELNRYFLILSTAAHAAMAPDPKVYPGPTQCEYCKARHACKALQSSTYAAMDVANTPTPFELPAEAIGIELSRIDKYVKLLEARRTGLEVEAESMLKKGSNVPGYTLEESKPRERWVLSSEDLTLVGIPLKQPEAVTPAQARKAGIDIKLVESLSERPHGVMKLSTVSHKQARKIFK